MFKFKRRLLTSTMLLSLCLFPVLSHAQIRDEEIEVYAALFNHLSKENQTQATIIVLSKTRTLSQNMLGGSAIEIKKSIPEATESVITDLLRVGEQQSDFDIPARFVRNGLAFSMLSQKTYFGIFSDTRNLDENWKLLHSRYTKPARLFSFSRAGIDSDKKQALFVFSSKSGGRSGIGFLVLMQKKWWRWEVVRIENIWVS